MNFIYIITEKSSQYTKITNNLLNIKKEHNLTYLNNKPKDLDTKIIIDEMRNINYD